MSDAPFTQRLKAFNSRLAVDSSTGALFVRDQMLVPVSAAPVVVNGIKPNGLGLQIQQYLTGTLHITPRLLTTVFAGLDNPGHFDDVAILQLPLPPGQTVLSVVHGLRHDVLTATTDKTKATPNHVMIPAPNSDWCPYGGPSPSPPPSSIHPLGPEGVDITVIDAGYMWKPPSPGPAWGSNKKTTDNPLHQLTTAIDLHEADWLHVNPAGTVGRWTKGKHNIPDANGDKKLDALAGHANFVAGVIAQHCERPVIHIWNHNSAFADLQSDWDNFSTEAAICRSLVMSQQAPNKPTPVIQIGHATAVYENVPSALWQIAFQRIGFDRNLEEELVLTCPAGNEGLLPAPIPTIPRIPAAFGGPTNPTGAPALIGLPSFPWVKGVASHNGTHPSNFSNHGPWVTCSTNGEFVVSTFLYVNMKTEEAPVVPHGANPGTDFRPHSWAMWNGTSFAAPQIAGRVAAQLSPSVNAGQAWGNLCSVAGAGCKTVPDYGIVL